MLSGLPSSSPRYRCSCLLNVTLLFSTLCICLHSPSLKLAGSYPGVLSFCPLQFPPFDLFSLMQALPQPLPSWICSAHSRCCCRVTCRHTVLAFLPSASPSLSFLHHINFKQFFLAFQTPHGLPNPVSLSPLLLTGWLLPLSFAIFNHLFHSTPNKHFFPDCPRLCCKHW